MQLWSLKTLQSIGPFIPVGTDKSYAFDISADGRFAASVRGTRVLVHDVRSGGVVAGPFIHPDTIESVAFVGNGERLLTLHGAEGEAHAKFWDIATTTLIAHYDVTGWLHCALSPDGTRLAINDHDRDVLVLRELFNGTAGDAELLAEAAEAISGFQVNSGGAIEAVQNRGSALQRLRAAVASAAAKDTNSYFVRWLLADRSTRPPSPFRGAADVHSGPRKP
jgi:hypothetical protein